MSVRPVVSAGTPVFSTKKTDSHDVTEIVLKVALSTIKPYEYSDRNSSCFLVLLEQPINNYCIILPHKHFRECVGFFSSKQMENKCLWCPQTHTTILDELRINQEQIWNLNLP